MTNAPSRTEQLVFFGVVLAILVAGVAWFHRLAASEESIARSHVAADLLAGKMEGRQGLIGSVRWAPLPTMLALPLVKAPWIGTSGLALALVNAVVAAFTLTLLNTWWATFGISRLVRYALLGFYQASPPIIGAVLTGSSSTVLLLLLIAGAYFLVRWVDTLDLRSLAYLGVVSGLAVITRFEVAALVFLVMLVVVVRVARSKEKSFRAATLLVFLIPPLYTGALWFLGNWLIMGDPAFFLRGLIARGVLRSEFTEFDWEWALYLMPALLLVTTWTLSAERARLEHIARRASTVVAFVVLVVGVAWPYFTLWRAHGEEPYFGRGVVEVRQADDVLHYLAQAHPDAKVFVSGYSGYAVIERAGVAEPDIFRKDGDTFVHLMSLDLAEIERRTHDQPLYFAVPKPKGLHRWEDINLEAPWLFDGYTGPPLDDRGYRFSFLLDRTVGDWRILQAVRRKVPSAK